MGNGAIGNRVGVGGIDTNQFVHAADGALMATDVYLPDRLPAPAIITRTPYGRSALLANGIGWARNGFVYIAQDVRGRYGSEGIWIPYHNERSDGRALVEWVGEQSWCDGNVILAGASYGSFTAWAAALAAPDLVRAVISEVPAAGMRQANFEPSGVLRLAEYVGWWTEHADGRTSRNGLSAQMLRSRPDLLRHLPVAEIGQHLWARLPHWWSTIDPDKSDKGKTATWEAEPGDQELARCALPSLHIGGWYDLFLPQTFHQWATVGSGCDPRPERGLVVGPWGHELSTPNSHSAGGREHGPESQLPLGRIQVDWISRVLAGGDASITKVFLMEGQRRRDHVSFALPEAQVPGSMEDEQWLDHWPASTGMLRLHATADGALSPTPPDQTAEHHFDYDPLDPFPSLPVHRDRAVLGARRDAVTFRSFPLTHPAAVAGSPTVRLSVHTTAPSADWIVRLVQRFDDGHALEITSGSAVTESSVRTLDVVLGATALVLHPGSRLELHVTSSDFPRLARNLNTGLDRYTTSATRTAIQTIHSGPVHGCFIELPVMEYQ
ncbi:hydrolase CocE/NonD family protein [Candidatus Protofrankia californiensis]|uniref:Hydrolase CocE/NonD family protein n=1 Tax=Candidatus Protofrankia californiensis TaxID=1839754 RepID=A0A1C3NYB2_9ACTN|nr:hydrolase CocE/NonD family protein [Candidatus Protofrankia californiensis]